MILTLGAKICERLILAFSINVSLTSVDLRNSVGTVEFIRPRSTLFLLKDRHSDVLCTAILSLSESVYVGGWSRKEMQDRRRRRVWWRHEGEKGGERWRFKPLASREIRSREILPQMRTRDHGINRYVGGAQLLCIRICRDSFSQSGNTNSSKYSW